MDVLSKTIGKKYMADLRIGGGSFGVVYIGRNLHTKERVAMKVEPTSTLQPQLIAEARLLKSLEGGVGIPKVHWYGSEGESSIMVMELLGPSLEELHDKQEVFSLKTTVMLGYQMVERLEYIHEHDVIHRDIKPDNFAMGLDSKAKFLYIIDFGLSKKFRDPKMKMHIRYREGKSLTGTARYASVHTHIGIEQSRRDDLEAVGYVLLYLLKGSLPWQNIRAHTKQEKYHKIMELKLGISVERLCESLPPEFTAYMHYCKSLQFESAPDYSYLKHLFTSISTHYHFSFNNIFDWSEQRRRSTSKATRKKKKRARKNKAADQKSEHLPTIEDKTVPEFKDRSEIMRMCYQTRAFSRLNTLTQQCAVF